MIEIKEKNECCGCYACYNKCPKHCIEMIADSEGFVYPKVDTSVCVECGVCENVCPMIHAPKVTDNTDNPLIAYAIRNRKYDILNESASGGFFSAIAESVLKQNGIVFGVAFDSNFIVQHCAAENVQEAERFRTSKYVQSRIDDSYCTARKELQKGRLVCFSGTPCQIEGLRRYLGKDYENLILVDLVCHGVPSPKLWKEYRAFQEKKFASNIVSVNFRKKKYGYHSGLLEIVFSNGKKYYGSMRNDMMIKCFFSEISSRPSCYSCKFKHAKHSSDFTMFDSWHTSELVSGLIDDDKGYTNIFVQTEKGKNLIEELEDYIEIYPIDAEKAILLDGSMVRNSAIAHPKRYEFYEEFNSKSLEAAVSKFIPISTKDRFVIVFRDVLYRVGVLSKARKFVKKLKV